MARNIEELIAQYERSHAWHKSRTFGPTNWLLLLTKWSGFAVLGIIGLGDVQILGKAPFYADVFVWLLAMTYFAADEVRRSLENDLLHRKAAKKYADLAEAAYLMESSSFRRALKTATPDVVFSKD